jgi:hypothetical protein
MDASKSWNLRNKEAAGKLRLLQCSASVSPRPVDVDACVADAIDRIYYYHSHALLRQEVYVVL